jgi:hypothetical protein
MGAIVSLGLPSRDPPIEESDTGETHIRPDNPVSTSSIQRSFLQTGAAIPHVVRPAYAPFFVFLHTYVLEVVYKLFAKIIDRRRLSSKIQFHYAVVSADHWTANAPSTSWKDTG